jgi:putative SOS response-associated peptidase YedK
MCGRYVSVSSPTILAERFLVDEVRVTETEPSYNVTPRAEVPVVAVSQGRRVLDLVRWGLVPSWAKDLKIGDRQINARAEKITTSNAYKRAFAKRRCIIPADGFYEWQAVEHRKQKVPWFFRRCDGEPLAFAGLWEIWHDRSQGDDAPRVRSCVIITTDANEVVAPIHHRMPALLPESAWAEWLDRENQDVDSLRRLLVPAAVDELEAWPVTTLVNKPENNGPELLTPAPAVSEASAAGAAIWRE